MLDWKDLLTQLFTALHQKQFDQAKRLRCGNCKTTLEDVLKVGKLGCPQCYDIFGPTLRQIVDQMHSKHCGKHPKSKAIRSEITGLEDRMATAALEGFYEEAERIRDEIKRLRGT